MTTIEDLIAGTLTILSGKIFYSFQNKNGCLAAFDLFHVFTQSIKFYTFYYTY